MKKRGLEQILQRAKELGIPASMSPSATPLLNEESFSMMKSKGTPGDRPKGHTSQTRDGKGIIFVAHNGDVNPSGFLPINLGNVDPLEKCLRSRSKPWI